MAPKGGSNGGQQDSYVYVPVATLQSRIGFVRNPTGEINVNQINVQTVSNADKTRVQQTITDFLAQRHAVATPDFTVQSQDDLIGAAGEVSRTLSILLGSIAGISLVVGGIGVMNIMLVSVTERTREIGIRRAVGARARDIIMQFVTEALALCAGGGVLGIVIGVGVAVGIDGRDIADQQMSTVVQPWSIFVAFGVAAGIGALSGSYPAYRASRLDPITALRNSPGNTRTSGKRPISQSTGRRSWWFGTSSCGSRNATSKSPAVAFGGGTLQTPMIARRREAFTNDSTKGTISRTK